MLPLYAPLLFGLGLLTQLAGVGLWRSEEGVEAPRGREEPSEERIPGVATTGESSSGVTIAACMLFTRTLFSAGLGLGSELSC